MALDSSNLPERIRRRLPPDDPLYLPHAHAAIPPHYPRAVPDPQPKRHQAAALERAATREEESLSRPTVRFVGYRVRPLDPDNFAGSIKDLLDGLRHAGLIPGDEPWRIRLETEQEKVGTFAEEKTVISIEHASTE